MNKKRTIMRCFRTLSIALILTSVLLIVSGCGWFPKLPDPWGTHHGQQIGMIVPETGK